MKGLKKVLALVLSVCMLIGMPLSINVSAADPLEVVSAMLVPEHIANDSNSTGLDATKSIHLYFNKAANVDLNKTKAVVVRCNVNGVAINYWSAKLAKNTAFGDTNNLVVTIDNTTLASIKSDYNNAWGADRIVVRLFDATTGIDHKFSGISDSVMKKHIVCFGDSNTHGYCVDLLDLPPGQRALAAALADIVPGLIEE